MASAARGGCGDVLGDPWRQMSGRGGPGLSGAALDYPAGVCWDSVRRCRSSLIVIVDSTFASPTAGA